MPLTIYEAQLLLDSLFGSGTPATLYVGLFLTSPTDTGGGIEVTGTNYARVGVTNNNTQWAGATATYPSIVKNTNPILYASAGSNWGTVGFWAIFDSASGGNMLWWGTLATGINVTTGNVFEFGAGNLALTLG